MFHRLAPSCVRNVTNDDDVSTMAHCDVGVEGSLTSHYFFPKKKLHEVYDIDYIVVLIHYTKQDKETGEIKILYDSLI